MITLTLVPDAQELLQISVQGSEPTPEELIAFLRRTRQFSQIMAPAVNPSNQVTVAISPDLEMEPLLQNLAEQLKTEFGVPVDCQYPGYRSPANAKPSSASYGAVNEGLGLWPTQIDQ